jgi:hypothetical protein
MKPIGLSRDQFAVLQEIAGADFDYATTKRLCSGAGWQMVEDEPDIGFVQYYLWVGSGRENRRLLSIGTPELDGPPHIYLPLYYFPEEEGGAPAEHDRKPFDEAYRRLAEGMDVLLGRAKRDGTYEYSHRSGWPYSFRAWQIPEAQIFLLQDEHDIQFGMDLSLWLFRPEPDVAVPLPL